MAIVKVDPFRELAAMQDRMARLFGDAYLRDEDTGFRGSWTPVVDIFEEDVTHLESHGIRDKGTVTGHSYLVLE